MRDLGASAGSLSRTYSCSSDHSTQPTPSHRSASQEAVRLMGHLEEEELKRIRSDSTKPWLQGPLSLSRQSCRFELPMDMKVLENLSPLEYVSLYCRINSRRRTLFRHYFTKNDKDKDGFINHRELLKALRDLYAQSITVEQVNAILGMLEIEEMSKKIDLSKFLAIAAFSERFLYCFFNSMVQDVSEKRTVLEETDFGALTWKLEGCTISDSMRKLLRVL
ncbi:uncharacterized protein LOC116604611 [Nematostella vectensis]|uniref:uncharacterized protein LOC116604611 n=1 Tax=Nematostella vectensis TaxID=45351 RepID=UPI002076EC20|nr:uncharacterized protein LOC116604611 [Nematostella vectensis]XP_032223101.2 uncharacterized protein LOC116604611 [Nematostella vectensis]XP_032223102.2 uncharacterized protein LOC116604611 [Nematostella vectensis]XP_032223103.2 uncharacterized protein LOC116604611 [Nematostella vectensis]XP_032223104.2 uncharacterized protein LOC116604611 [Nematostella vectensis]